MKEEIAETEEMENSEMSDDKAGGEKSPPVSRSRLRKDSIRGHPERKFECDSEITEPDRQNRKKKMVTAYAAKEQKRYHEKAEVDEKSMEDFREEIKGKTKREQIRKEQKKSKSRLSFEDESKGVIPGSGMAKRGASAVSETVADYGQKKVREDTDDNAALDAADQMELAGESLARKSVYVRERLKENRQRNNQLRESVLEETEKSRLQFGTSVSDEAKRAVQKETEQKKQSALKKLLQKKRYQKQYQAAKQGKAAKDAVLVNAQRFTEKAKAAVKEIVAQNRNILLSIGVLVLLFALMATSLSSCAALFQGSSNAIISTSYSSEDEDIYAAENAYVALENALNEQINQMKANHSDYDEFQFQIDEIGHNPYQLISYLTVKYGGFTYAEVADEIQEIFKEQYGLYTDSTRETVTEKKTVRVGESLGQVVTSGYCNRPICCGQWSGGPTASGAYVYMMSLVDEQDLAEFLDENEETEKKEESAVVLPEITTTPETETTVQPETEVKPESSGNKMFGSAVLGGGIVLVFGGLAAFALSKFRKKKEDGIVEEGLEFADDSYINEDEENAEDQQK